MDRRTVVASAAALAIGSVMPSAARAITQGSATRRNVVLIVSDDQGLDLGCLGVDVLTPRLDALARNGTRFDRAYAAVSSCSPSRGVLYTGLYSHQNGLYGLAHTVHNQSLLDGIETLPVLLKAAGYTTALVGKKHVRPESAFPMMPNWFPSDRVYAMSRKWRMKPSDSSRLPTSRSSSPLPIVIRTALRSISATIAIGRAFPRYTMTRRA